MLLPLLLLPLARTLASRQAPKPNQARAQQQEAAVLLWHQQQLQLLLEQVSSQDSEALARLLGRPLPLLLLPRPGLLEAVQVLSCRRLALDSPLRWCCRCVVGVLVTGPYEQGTSAHHANAASVEAQRIHTTPSR